MGPPPGRFDMDGVDAAFKAQDMTHHHVRGLTFSGYTSDEIRALSCQQVTESKTFDDLGHPVESGLCDTRMGPNEDDEHCGTCSMPKAHCPGHMGHIELPLPLFNPVFTKLTLQIVKGSCVSCHRLMCLGSPLPYRVLMAQLKAIEIGEIWRVDQIQTLVNGGDTGETEKGKRKRDHGMDESRTLSLLETFMASLESANGGCTDPNYVVSGLYAPVRNEVEMRTRLINDFKREQLFKKRTKCPHCGQRQPSIRDVELRTLHLDFRAPSSKKGGADVLDVGIHLPGLLTKTEIDADGIPMDVDEMEMVRQQQRREKVEFDGDPDAGGGSSAISDAYEGKTNLVVWRAEEVRQHLLVLWESNGGLPGLPTDGDLLADIFPVFKHTSALGITTKTDIGTIETIKSPVDILFCSAVPVPPNKFRPLRMFQGNKFEHSHTANLKKVIEDSELVFGLMMLMQGTQTQELQALITKKVQGKDLVTKFHNAYAQLQGRVNALYDSDMDTTVPQAERMPGLRQLIEKKEGLFRKHMMGKRVNFACRSVITPDPYLAIDEIGIPEVFAKKLTFTEFVNTHNVEKMRALVERGPNNHPGANFIVNDAGHKTMLNDSVVETRIGHARRLHPPRANVSNCSSKAVLRHLERGDVMLMNRQPTLHRPSIMAHRTRVLKGQRALRMNYAPCKAYNADFDGDEMNGHFVQNFIAKAEAIELMSARRQYLVPKDNTPILGLIQDHVISGVFLTIKDRFFNREDYNYLVLSAFDETTRRLKLLRPAILKPTVRWTGKQVVSTVILNVLPTDVAPLNLSGKAKTAADQWYGDPADDSNADMSKESKTLRDLMGESKVEIRAGELLQGVLDKGAYGSTAYGLIHCVYELYGPICGSQLLSCFSRLFTTFLQYHGFTLGVADILVKKPADKKRRKTIRKLRKMGAKVVTDAFGVDESDYDQLKLTLEAVYRNPQGNKGDIKQLDYYMKKALDDYNVSINKTCIPHGLVRPFPKNSLQAMIQCGAKGTSVNAIQISCLLGQIELEGCRPPLTVFGRTLPSFDRYDPSPRAGGFVDQRFLTGINPQELFFHTMAGREGLIDTAVKTSRSGYLQRCIIKHLEGLMVNYDMTVRDSDKSVVQFRYGEDGMDGSRVQFLKSASRFPILKDNLNAIVPDEGDTVRFSSEHAETLHAEMSDWKSRFLGKPRTSGFILFVQEQDVPNYEPPAEETDSLIKRKQAVKDRLVAAWFALSSTQRHRYQQEAAPKCPPPVNAVLNPARIMGAVPEKLADAILCTEPKMKQLLFWKAMKAVMDPGENVGLLAAQSIGEPSTQMTLNTFHFAGRGEMNVTLGIPRLREILMTASKAISTPTAQAPARKGVTKEQVEHVRRKMDKVLLKSVLKKFVVQETLHFGDGDSSSFRQYALTIQILRRKQMDEDVAHLTPPQILAEIEKGFAKRLCQLLGKKLNEITDQRELEHRRLRGKQTDDVLSGSGVKSRSRNADDDGGASSDEEEVTLAAAGGELDADEARLHSRHDDAGGREYEGEQEELGEVLLETQLSDLEDASDHEDGADKDVDEAEASATTDDVGAQRRKSQELNVGRVQAVVKASNLIVDYRYDVAKERWCTLVLQLPISRCKLDVYTLIRRVINEFVVQSTPGIEKCMMREENGEFIIQTQGTNLPELFKHTDVLDVSRVYSNDIHVIANTYGIEAATKAILKEVVSVFGCYGIEVDHRHLSLTSDYMTFTGTIHPFNRKYMETSSSPLQKMSFETTTAFLQQALQQGQPDNLDSPSGSLVLGQMVKMGTGCFDLLIPWRKVL